MTAQTAQTPLRRGFRANRTRKAPLSFSDGERRSAPRAPSPQGGLQEWVFRKTPVLKERPTRKESSANVAARTIGIDLSQETSTYVALGADGDLLGEGKFPTTAEGIDSAFGEAPTSRMILEASGLTHWVARRLEGMGHEVIVANPRRLYLISKSTRKTDRNDAHTLARLGRVDPGLLHPIWLRDEKCLAVRAGLPTVTCRGLTKPSTDL